MDMELITAQIARLSLKPEDTLVVRCDANRMHDGDAQRVRQIVEEATGHKRVLVIDTGISLSILEPLA